VFGVAGAGSGTLGSYLFHVAHLVGGELHVESGGVFFQILTTLCAGNGNDVFTAREQPGQSELARRALLLLGDLADARDQIQILLEVFSLKAR